MKYAKLNSLDTSAKFVTFTMTLGKNEKSFIVKVVDFVELVAEIKPSTVTSASAVCQTK